jgi:lysophospholipase L1-like esterase
MASSASLRKRLALGLASLVVATGSLEGASWLLVGRVVYPPDPFITTREARRQHEREYDPLLFWRLEPGSGVEGDRVNSLGLRAPEIPPKEEGEFRVLSLGESTTYGWNVRPEESHTSLLEERLRKQRKTRVVNAGSPGYSLFQGRVFLEYFGLDLRPDVVLLYFGHNDFLKVAFRDQRDALAADGTQGLTDRELFAIRRRWPARAAHWLYGHSNFLRWIGRRASGGTVQEESTEEHAMIEQVRRGENKARVPDPDRWTLLVEIHELCRANGIELVVIIPVYRGFARHSALLRRFVEEKGVPSVDLPEYFREQGLDKEALFTDPIHPGIEGHRVIAEAIWKAVGIRW